MEKAPITLNDALNFYQHSRSTLQHKGNLVSLQFQAAHFGIGANPKQAGSLFRKKTAQKLDRIEKTTLLSSNPPCDISGSTGLDDQCGTDQYVRVVKYYVNGH